MEDIILMCSSFDPVTLSQERIIYNILNFDVWNGGKLILGVTSDHIYSGLFQCGERQEILRASLGGEVMGSGKVEICEFTGDLVSFFHKKNATRLVVGEGEVELLRHLGLVGANGFPEDSLWKIEGGSMVSTEDITRMLLDPGRRRWKNLRRFISRPVWDFIRDHHGKK